jgi:hypothetical protein
VVRLADGREFEAHVPFRPGSQKMPDTRDDVREKFRGLAGQVLPAARVAEIDRSVFTLPDIDRICTLTDLLVSLGSGPDAVTQR